MGRLILISILVLCFSFIIFAQEDETPDRDEALESKRIRVAAKFGFHFFQDEPLNDAFKDAMTGGVEVSYWFANGMGLSLEAFYFSRSNAETRWGHTDHTIVSYPFGEITATGYKVMDIEYTHIPVNFNFCYRFPYTEGAYYPYVMGGLSYNSLSTENSLLSKIESSHHNRDVIGSTSNDESALGYNFVLGVESRGLLTGLLVELRYNYCNIELVTPDFDGNIKEEINLGGFTIVAGWRF